jgi:8-oxo-dGTP pyrophosphatase MutT (NUDIX family)
MSQAAVIAHPSATVVLLRDRPSGLELLLVRRSSKLVFHGGAWVFPGGRIDPEDYAAGADGDVVAASRKAAVREIQEEAGLTVDPAGLILISHWTTPEGLPRRFATWFYAAAVAGEGRVEVDGGEIKAHRWIRPGDALAAQWAGEIELPPPTYVTTHAFTAYGSADDALSTLREREPEIFFPRVQLVPGGACFLYEGDAGYADSDPGRPGARNRLWRLDGDWRYERSS